MRPHIREESDAPTPIHRDQRNYDFVRPDGKIYAFGGGNCLIFFDDAQVYDPSANTWTAVASMPASRAYTAAGGSERAAPPLPSIEGLR